MSLRMERLEDLLARELAAIFQREVKDPRVRLTTVSSISVSRDLSHATVRVSVLGNEDERKRCVQALEHARGFIRRTLARRVRLRTVPELEFQLDRGAEHSQRISEILESLHADSESP